MVSDTVRSLGVAAEGSMAFFESADVAAGPGELRVETCYTGLSAGTELSVLKGTNPYLHARWDPDLRAFVEGEPTQRYPVRSMGYMEVARVAESRSPAVGPGALVAMAYGHRTAYVADPTRELVVGLPDGFDPVLGVYVAQMGPICANGLLYAAADLVGPQVNALGDGVAGRRILVTGGGVVGLLTGLYARAHGAEAVAVADTTPQRLAAAEALGLTPVDERAGPAWRWCKQRWRHGPGDRGADVVFQCRGNPQVLAAALRALRPHGTVIDLAFYQSGAPQLNLGEEFHHNWLTIRCAQIGRPPRGVQGWDRRRLSQETIALLCDHGRVVREQLVTDVVPLEEAPQLMAEVAARRRHVLTAVFAVEAPLGDSLTTSSRPSRRTG